MQKRTYTVAYFVDAQQWGIKDAWVPNWVPDKNLLTFEAARTLLAKVKAALKIKEKVIESHRVAPGILETQNGYKAYHGTHKIGTYATFEDAISAKKQYDEEYISEEENEFPKVFIF
jgi:phosphotransferase system IIB component